uniref:Aryl-hydrocarbon receptor repressor b n=1 Tax=Paramormyrops kingsleyae TaxID=1676925 RepID=A0A3B3R7R4_9TELE|nr:uncharacterized protein LOC111834002 [Paramormyrops kingsleyae]XP_023648614.1 uncharacterized protein LOC111834002 [Paramormyrops kingsleyae]
MIPPGDCMYAGRKRRKPVQKQKPQAGSQKSNPSKRHRDRLNAELDRLAGLLPFPPDVISKLDKLSVLRLSVSYLRVKSFFQAIQEKAAGESDSEPARKEALLEMPTAMESEMLLESLPGFALVVSTDGMIFYVSPTIAKCLGFHQTDVMHQNVFDYIHLEDRRELRRQLHWAMKPSLKGGLEPQPAAGAGEDFVVGSLFGSQDYDFIPPEFQAFLQRCFAVRMRCLLDSTSGFLAVQFQGRLKLLQGQKRKTALGSPMPPQLALFCMVTPLQLPPIAGVKSRSAVVRSKLRSSALSVLEHSEKRLLGAGGKVFSEETQLVNHTPWTPPSRNEGLYVSEEPLKFCRPAVDVQKALGHESVWRAHTSPGALMLGQNCSHLTNRPGKVGHFGKAGSYQDDAQLATLYNNMQTTEQESFCSGGIKEESGLSLQGECYGSRILQDMPIKVEPDSDSDTGCDIYGMPPGETWMSKGLSEQNCDMGYGLSLPIKREYSCSVYTPCQTARAGTGAPCDGFYQAARGGHRPEKCPSAKVPQFSVQCFSYPDGQARNGTGSHLYGNLSVEDRDYVELGYKSTCRSHGLLHAIKCEPADSPPWPDSHQHFGQVFPLRNGVPDMFMNAVANKSNPYVYMQ